jgi:uncharacterized protein (DUF1501 family)
MDSSKVTLISIFLRGGADGLNMVVPYGDPDYAGLRPTLAIFPPGEGTGRCLDLDGFFGFHPAFAPLLPLYRSGRLAIVHAAGSDDGTRSHFEAQDQMEHGAAFGQRLGSGWVGRYLRARGSTGNLAAVAVGSFVPEALRGAPGVAAMTSLAELQLRGVGENELEIVGASLRALYGGEDALARAGLDTLGLMAQVEALAVEEDKGDTTYPPGAFGNGLRDVARLIRADLGLEVACLDLGGWDSHYFQGSTVGVLPGRIEELSQGLAAFEADLGEMAERVVTVVQTEFGRRAYENTSLGTDHGRGSVMLVLGSGLRGGKVHGIWPGLAREKLVGPGDLAVTTDYRSVLVEVIERVGSTRLSRVFPDFTSREVGLLG